MSTSRCQGPRRITSWRSSSAVRAREPLPKPLLPSELAQREQAAGLVRAGQFRVVVSQVACELHVVLEPPGRRHRDEEKLGASFAQLLELLDRRAAVRRVVSGVGSTLVLWEVPRRSPAQLQQMVVAS